MRNVLTFQLFFFFWANSIGASSFRTFLVVFNTFEWVHHNENWGCYYIQIAHIKAYNEVERHL